MYIFNVYYTVYIVYCTLYNSSHTYTKVPVFAGVYFGARISILDTDNPMTRT